MFQRCAPGRLYRGAEPRRSRSIAGSSLVTWRHHKTPEAELLDANPGARASVTTSEGFQGWLASLQSVVVDGETFYVIGGDQLKDCDQCIAIWARGHAPHLLPNQP